MVFGRVARLSSPRRAVAHRGRAERAGEAITRCTGARGPPASDAYGGNEAAPRGTQARRWQLTRHICDSPVVSVSKTYPLCGVRVQR